MNAAVAARIITEMRTKPGWTITARPSDWSSANVILTITLDSVDSGDAPFYRKPIHQQVENSFYVGDVRDVAGLTAKLITLMRDYEGHEWAEFLRVPNPVTGRWEAPCHPHTTQGRRALADAGLYALMGG